MVRAVTKNVETYTSYTLLIFILLVLTDMTSRATEQPPSNHQVVNQQSLQQIGRCQSYHDASRRIVNNSRSTILQGFTLCSIIGDTTIVHTK